MNQLVVYPSEGGHYAACTRCGWKTRTYPVPDTAYAKGKTHQCKEDASDRPGPRVELR